MKQVNKVKIKQGQEEATFSQKGDRIALDMKSLGTYTFDGNALVQAIDMLRNNWIEEDLISVIEITEEE